MAKWTFCELLAVAANNHNIKKKQNKTKNIIMPSSPLPSQ